MFEDLQDIPVPTETLASDALIDSPFEGRELKWLAFMFWNISVKMKKWTPVKAEIPVYFVSWKGKKILIGLSGSYNFFLIFYFAS